MFGSLFETPIKCLSHLCVASQNAMLLTLVPAGEKILTAAAFFSSHQTLTGVYNCPVIRRINNSTRV